MKMWGIVSIRQGKNSNDILRATYRLQQDRWLYNMSSSKVHNLKETINDMHEIYIYFQE